MNLLDNLQNETKNFNILYVEDEEDAREQTKDILKLLFNSVDTAVDGKEGFDAYMLSSYDIVITDINMPRMDGIAFIKRIREINENQKIIIISAHNDAEYLIPAIELGVDGFIVKPIQMIQLEKTLFKVTEMIHTEKLLGLYQEHLEEEVKAKTAELVKKIVTDDLTGLLNRKALNKMLLMSQYQIILLVNIDNFETLNLTYGYEKGDLILQKVSEFLQTHKLDKATLYSIEGDEFVFLFMDESVEKIIEYAYILKELIAQYVISINNNDVKLTLTTVVADGKENLLHKAHIALKESRKKGKNRIDIYKEGLPIEILQARIAEYMPFIKESLIKNHVVPYFQPIVNNKSMKIEKYECLARIVDNQGRVYTPDVFIDIAQLTGMLPDITKIMIDKSFAAFKENDFNFSINITENDLNDGYLEYYLAEKLYEYNIDASRVVLEVLEGISANGAQQSLDQIQKFKEKGFCIAIDDFGAQNSNFERVNSMSVDFIKIDGSFIKNMDTNENNYKIVKTITDFSKSIGAKIIAEFVCSQAIFDHVLDLGIEYSQGYHFAQPQREIVFEIPAEGINTLFAPSI